MRKFYNPTSNVILIPKDKGTEKVNPGQVIALEEAMAEMYGLQPVDAFVIDKPAPSRQLLVDAAPGSLQEVTERDGMITEVKPRPKARRKKKS